MQDKHHHCAKELMLHLREDGFDLDLGCSIDGCKC
jgi:hypothetical protein